MALPMLSRRYNGTDTKDESSIYLYGSISVLQIYILGVVDILDNGKNVDCRSLHISLQTVRLERNVLL